MADADGTILLTPPGSLHTLETVELRQWAFEICHARGISVNHHSTSWQRPPSWCLPWTPPQQSDVRERMLDAVKKPAGMLGFRGASYPRIVRVRSRARDSDVYEVATIHPQSRKVTNRWSILEMSAAHMQGSSVFISLPGGLFRRRTLLEIFCANEEAAAALLVDFGWEKASEDGLPANPPVKTATGEEFVFRH